MHIMILLVVGILGCAGVGSAQIVQQGQCSSISLMGNFVLNSFMGQWYEIGKSSSQNADCSNLAFTIGNDGTITVSNPSVVNNFLVTSTGTATHATGTAQLTLALSGSAAPINFWILGSDYTNYAIAINCVNINTNQRQLNVWQLGRAVNSYDTATTLNAANTLLSPLSLSVSNLTPVDHSTAACTQLPVIGDGQAVILDGQCDTASIPVVQNFNVERFLGTWHEIRSYYSVNAVGNCARAEYTLAGSVVDVVNSQVLNQQLAQITGTASLIGTDQSGRLNVTLNVQGVLVEQELLALATDYTGYLVSYSCTNIGSTQRQVNAWILSREQTLSAESQTAVDNVIASLVDLNNAYFIPTDQSDSACFYFPEAQAGTPVIFPGSCDQTIPVEANFDPVAYMGLWHDISSYPSTFQTGTCNNAFYTLMGDVVDVFNTQVINQQLDTINGAATIPNAAEPAKLLVTFPNQTAPSNYWILSTDHTNYSLVYSCTDLFSTNQKVVFSWMLSREKSLSAASIAAINAVTSTIQVLDERYYVDNLQTEAGCFYFPEDTDDTVVFPGVCDDTIVAVPNFNLAQFTGIWHEIEAYPKEPQTGSCINHVFSTGIGNSLNFVSNQVVNQTPTTASGSITLESTDGSGKLLLTMAMDGQRIEFPYWVLSTDYNTFAFVYSCLQLNADYRSVFSWKLSRTQVLPPAAAEPINTAIAAVQVLDQRYFRDVDQSETGCFYYPEIAAGDPIILQGQCGTATPVANFQSAQFAGTWHEIARYASAGQTGACAAKQFTTTAQNTFSLTQTIVYNERLTTVSGTATLAADGSGTLTATLSDGADLTYTTTMYILDTDYTEYAVVYGCENIQGTNNRQIFSWKLSRSQFGFTQAATERIAQVVADTTDLLERYYQSTAQTSTDCFYYPNFEETPAAIVLPGSCPIVNGVPNFNPSNYLGDWYDVARYPIASQFGTCPRAQYSLVDGVITIRNTMVVNETLRVQNGIGRLSAAGTGLVTVTVVNENGEEYVQQHFILGTDYTSFSLAYACRNLADGNREVTSWKLSRTPTLTAEANNAINAIISSTQGLLEDYYQGQNHTDQDCFYVPELVPGQSMLFPGACESVVGMQGFVPSQYLGWWHEIERYPSDDDRGQCTSADFVDAGSNAINVVEVGIYNGVANETTNSATIGANGVITISGNGQSRQWTVIHTDYNSYSLLYSCEDVITASGTYRRVWSAKHSKQNSLSDAANSAMEPHIQSSPVLHQHLYEGVNQSSAACFHYREDAGEQVILRGQCDTSIPVQQNFNVTRFAGKWYHIERYPYTNANNDATCIGTSLTESGAGISVENWEVLGENLSVSEGTATVNGATISVTLSAGTTNIHILTTDYDGYALAYTCSNINSFQRTVGAFKLSRSRALNNAAQSAIQTYMATREELHQAYFTSIAQDDDCLEPSSAFLFKSSIVVMLVSTILHLVM